MLTFDLTAAGIATIALPCAAIVFGAATLMAAARRRLRRAITLALISSVCVLGTFVAATIAAHVDGLVALV